MDAHDGIDVRDATPPTHTGGDAQTHATSHDTAVSSTHHDDDNHVSAHASPPPAAAAVASGGDAVCEQLQSISPPRTLDAAAVGAVSMEDTSATTVSSLCERELGCITPPLRAETTVDSALPPEPSTRQSLPYTAPNIHETLPLSPSPASAAAVAVAALNALSACDPNHRTPIECFTSPPQPPATTLLTQLLSPSDTKRKRVEPRDELYNNSKNADAPPRLQLQSYNRPTDLLTESPATTDLQLPARRKGSGDYLRKGQWTATEEKCAAALIEAFEAGILPIYTGIRLRGYLAVQLQCDPMRISKKLCGGSVDGRVVPKNFGQRKFKLRQRLASSSSIGDDTDDADVGLDVVADDAATVAAQVQALARIEQLQADLWAETGIPRPAFLTLSSTRNGSDDCGHDAATSLLLASERSDATSPVPLETASQPAAAAATATRDALPIIYFSLTKKKPKLNGVAASRTTTTASMTPSVKVDGDSLQAAYELLKLFQAPLDPSPVDAA